MPIATKVVCFSQLLKCLRRPYGKQCGPRSDCSYRSSLFWVHAVCFYTSFIGNVRQLFAADNFSRRHFQIHFSWHFKGYAMNMILTPVHIVFFCCCFFIILKCLFNPLDTPLRMAQQIVQTCKLRFMSLQKTSKFKKKKIGSGSRLV